MKYKGLDDKFYVINARDYVVYNDDDTTKSKHHCRARKLIKQIFPCNIVLEEVLLKGSKTHNNKNLRADFLIPDSNLLVEVHGEQHYEFVGHFYKTQQDMFNAMLRDKIKKEWCENNNIELIILPYNEDDDEWSKRLKRENIC